jgi:hypothetical protein
VIASRRTILNGWPLIHKIWFGIVIVGFLVAAYRMDKEKYGYWEYDLRLAPLALLAALIWGRGVLVLVALHLVR